MATAPTLAQYLDRNGIVYDVLPHAPDNVVVAHGKGISHPGQ